MSLLQAGRLLAHRVPALTTIAATAAAAAAVAGGALAAVGHRGYHGNVIEHFNNPKNVGSLDKKDPRVGTGLVGAPACGDVMKLQIKVGDDGVISDAKFKTFGCGSAIASSSLATEMIVGKTLEEAAALTNHQIAKELHLPPVKHHCSMLAEDAVSAAIRDVEAKMSARKAAEPLDAAA